MMMTLFQLRAGHPPRHVSGVALYIGYEATVLGNPCLINQWSEIPIPYADARPAMFDTHFLGRTFTHRGYFMHQPEPFIRQLLFGVADGQLRTDLGLWS